MIFEKKLIMNDIVIQVVKNIIQTTLINVLINKVLPYVSYLFNIAGPYYLIYVYLIIAVIILFVLYKIFVYFRSSKLSNRSSKLSSKSSSKTSNKTSISSSDKISSIITNSDDFNLDPIEMEKKKNKKSRSSKNVLTTDLLSSY